MHFAATSLSTLALLAAAALALATTFDEDDRTRSLLARYALDELRSSLTPRADAAVAAGLAIPAKCKEWVLCTAEYVTSD